MNMPDFPGTSLHRWNILAVRSLYTDVITDVTEDIAMTKLVEGKLEVVGYSRMRLVMYHAVSPARTTYNEQGNLPRCAGRFQAPDKLRISLSHHHLPKGKVGKLAYSHSRRSIVETWWNLLLPSSMHFLKCIRMQ